MSSISSFFSSFVTTIYADAPEEPKAEAVEAEAVETEAPEAVEEEEEEEPEDIHPAVRDECKEKRCVSLAKHFDHCQEKVQAGEGFKGEDCVEELMMHCIDECAAPKLFEKLV